MYEQHQGCNGYRAFRDCSRLWVWSLVKSWSNQRLWNWCQFALTAQSIQLLGVRAKTSWHGIRMMFQSGATCLPVKTVVSVIYHYKNHTKRVGVVQSRHHHLIKCNLFLPWYSWKIAQLVLNKSHSLTHYSLCFLQAQTFLQYVLVFFRDIYK